MARALIKIITEKEVNLLQGLQEKYFLESLR